MGIMSAENLKIIGELALSGSVVTISSLSRTSLVATSMSMPYSNSRVMIETFSFDFEVMCFRSSTPLSVFSKGRVMLFSISSALAPAYVVMTMIEFDSISG